MLFLFKSKKKEVKKDPSFDDDNSENASIQGSYTDHYYTPYQLRMADESNPLVGEELKRFYEAINKVNDEVFDGRGSISDLVDECLARGYFQLGKNGEMICKGKKP
jgi:hypothetical protein